MNVCVRLVSLDNYSWLYLQGKSASSRYSLWGKSLNPWFVLFGFQKHELCIKFLDFKVLSAAQGHPSAGTSTNNETKATAEALEIKGSVLPASVPVLAVRTSHIANSAKSTKIYCPRLSLLRKFVRPQVTDCPRESQPQETDCPWVSTLLVRTVRRKQTVL